MSSFTSSGGIIHELEEISAQVGIVREALLRSSREHTATASHSDSTAAAAGGESDSASSVQSFGGPWLSPEMAQSIKALKQFAKGCGDLCTRIGVMGVASMQQGEVKQSVYDELLPLLRNSLACFMSLVQSGNLGGPLFNQIANGLRSLVELVIGVVKIIESKIDTGLKSAVGMVWEAADAAQKLPESNKAAYRRFVMKNIGIIEETSTEFQGYLEEFRAGAGAEEVKGEGEEGGDEDDDDADAMAEMLGDMSSYSEEDASIVEAAVKRVHLARQVVKGALTCMSEFGEYVTAKKASVSPDCAGWPVWIERVAAASADVQAAVVDLGAELYCPIDKDNVLELESDLDKVVGGVVKLISEPPPLGAEVEYVVNAVGNYRAELDKMSSLM